MRHLRLRVLGTLGIVVAVVFVTEQPGRAQAVQPKSADGGAVSRRFTLMATTPGALADSNSRIARMVQAGELTSVRVQNDPQIAGRQMQTLQQVYKGIPVEGGTVSIQKAGRTTISVFGTLFDNISIDTTPAIESVDAARIIEKAANAAIAFGASPTLVIVPSPVGTFALTYKATVEHAITYYVDAYTGAVVRVVDAKQYDTGLGTGTLGDQKKMATTLIGSTYRTRDTLRPGSISTYDTGGSALVLSRMENGNIASDNDLASNGSNTWTNGYVVDAHSNAGLTYDYFFRQHNWSGLDGNKRPISIILYSGLKDNSYFAPAPFGPNRNGEAVFGTTSATDAPVTSLDVVGHELMHGVTFFSLSNRTGSGFADLVYGIDGPTAFVYKGNTFPCNSTYVVDSQGTHYPFLCDKGRYVLGTNDEGTINEALSDIFGTSIEFFYQPPGSGPLKADYLVGEDIAGWVPRSLDNPASIPIEDDFGTIPYPDHYSKILRYALIVADGTASNPTAVEFSGAGFSNGQFVFFFQHGSDEGGVHLNSTIFSHAFYLAIEGGRDATSGVSVTGVGAANRAQIEKVFFRAITQLMPNDASLQTAAAAVIQAAVDLYGANAAATQAVTQAMTAVGLK